MSYELERRLNDLEARLDSYNRELTEVIEQRDKLCLDAAWGVVTGVNNLIALAIGISVISWFEISPWIEGVLFFLIYFGVLMLGAWQTERGKTKDEQKLWSLPRW